MLRMYNFTYTALNFRVLASDLTSPPFCNKRGNSLDVTVTLHYLKVNLKTDSNMNSVT